MSLNIKGEDVFRKRLIIITIITFTIIGMGNYAYSEVKPQDKKGFGIVVKGGIGIQGNSGGFVNKPGIESKIGLGAGGSITLEYLFMPYFGVSTGIGLSLKGSTYTIRTADPEVVVYEDVLYVQIPVTLIGRLPLKSLTLFIAGGVGFDFEIIESVNSEQNGVPSIINKDTYFLDSNSNNMSLLVSGGVEFPFRRRRNAWGIGITYDQHLMDEFKTDMILESQNSKYYNLLFDLFIKFRL